ncbi:hypothetical protein BDZ89DRAFT_1069292 [Hymenopellis radicata]|nr:hypothetical protein BDZ89DRAFT_1069285 [Hymenopellis radicata]KAF9024188.1 hypothetical protein BDZ89DRAFT_1069292 [Hymenopellis radicata]
MAWLEAERDYCHQEMPDWRIQPILHNRKQPMKACFSWRVTGYELITGYRAELSKLSL